MQKAKTRQRPTQSKKHQATATERLILAGGSEPHLADIPRRKSKTRKEHDVRRYFFLALAGVVGLIAVSCSHQRIQPQRPTDRRLSCQEMQQEMQRAEAAIREVEGKTGLSGRNVGMGLLFWPGIVVNELQGARAIDAANMRLARLHELSDQRGCGSAGSATP